MHENSADSGLVKASAITLAVSLLFAGSVYGQDDITVDVVPSGDSEAQQAAGRMEEVIVTGQRTLGSLIREGAQLTEDFYSRLNVVIDNDDFRINCQNEFPSGSRISRRVCRMRFQEDLMSLQSRSILRGIETNDDGQIIQSAADFDAQPELMRKSLEFEDALLQAVNTDTQLNAQVIRLIALKSSIDNYESPREQRRLEREADEGFGN